MRTKALKDIDDTINDPQQLGRRARRVDRARRLAAVLPAPRPLAHGDAGRRQARRRRSTSSRRTGRSACSCPKRSPIARRSPRPSTSPALVKDYKGDPAVAAGEAFDPTPANIEARTQRFALPNGMKVALLPKKTRGETVQFELRLDIGDETSLRNSSPSRRSPRHAGARHHEARRQAIEDALDQLRAKLDIGGGGATSRVGETVRASCPTCCGSRPKRCASRRSRRRVREAEARAADRARAGPHRSAARSRARARRAKAIRIRRATCATRRRSTRRSRASARPDSTAVKAFHAKFYGAAHAEIAIVGDFDVAAVKPLVRELFGDYAARRRTRACRAVCPMKAAPQTFETPDKAERGDVRPPGDAAQRPGARLPGADRRQSMLGGDSDSRLWKRVREKEGLTYGVGSVFQPARSTQQHVRRLRDLRAAEPREGQRGPREEVARAREGGSPRRRSTRRKGAAGAAPDGARQDDALAGRCAAFLGRTLAYSASRRGDRRADARRGERGAAQIRRPGRSRPRTPGDFAKVK